jgi:taurine dioxygenase
VHDFANARATGFRHERVLASELDANPPNAHPILRTHPETGRLSLFVNRGFTSHVEGLSPAESRAVLEFLFAHAERPDFQYRHVYRPRDLVVWDNRCTMHYAVMDYDGVAERMMHRTTVIGDRPV